MRMQANEGESQRTTEPSGGAHKDCKVRMRLVGKGDVFYIEKLVDTKHSEEKAVFDRINATLTKEQKAKFKLRKQGGSSASEIMKHEHQQEAVTAGAKRKEGEDETGVEGVQFERRQTHSCSRLSRADGRLSAFRRILTHVYALMHISTHAH